MDKGRSQEVDLERTDRLPILDGSSFDHDVEDDAVRLESVPSTVVLPVISAARGNAQTADFPRASGVDLPSLAESVRSVEERIARQTADFEALNRSYEKARSAESAAVVRADSLTGEIATVRGALESEQSRAREIDRALTEKSAIADEACARAAALQKERAEMVPALEARERTGAQLEAELQAARSQYDAVANELKISQAAAASMAERWKRGEADLQAARHALSIASTQVTAYMEQLRTREYRRGFDQNLFRELDARVGAAQVDHGALEAQRDQLRQQIAELQSKLASKDDVISTLQATAGVDAAAKAQHVQQLQQRELARGVLSDQIEALEKERASLKSDMAGHDAALAEARVESVAQVQRLKASLTAVEGHRAQLSAQVVMLREEAEAREVEMAVMVVNLQEARRPSQPIEADVTRLKDELMAKTQAGDQLNEENRALRASLERAKSTLEEREFLIRRLERSESTNANVLGRIQTSIERLGTTSPPDSPAAAPVECSAEFVRLNGGQTTAHVLGRRTRIGRAVGCELQIDYTSVSRHHALVLMGPRDVIIEDLNSTNGVIVNGRKISRQLLNDGDLIVIGEVQFRLALRLAPRMTAAVGAAPPGGTVTT